MRFDWGWLQLRNKNIKRSSLNNVINLPKQYDKDIHVRSEDSGNFSNFTIIFSNASYLHLHTIIKFSKCKQTIKS